MSTSLMPRPPRRGVTLLELLVVLLLMGLSAMLVLPALRPPGPGVAQDPVTEVLQSARRLAIRRGESVRLRVDTDGVWAVVATRDGGTLDGGHLSIGALARASMAAEDLTIDPMGSCLPERMAGSAGRFDPLSCRWLGANGRR